jgi:U4/U6.U5 tri-snRNP-associated protein 2
MSPFLFLALDLPATPLFTDSNEKKIIPQVPLSAILAKFDGKTTQEFGPTLKRHHLTALPPYLILHIKRFTKNNFVEEKNPTIVNFPLRGVELGECELLSAMYKFPHHADAQMSIRSHQIRCTRSTTSCPT